MIMGPIGRKEIDEQPTDTVDEIRCFSCRNSRRLVRRRPDEQSLASPMQIGSLDYLLAKMPEN